MTALDPRFAHAFAGHDQALRRVTVVRAIAVAIAIAVAVVVPLRPWALWTLIGLFVLPIGITILRAPSVLRASRRWRARLVTDPGALAWLHAGPVTRSAACRIELYDRAAARTDLHVTADLAREMAAAAHTLTPPPTVTTTADERDAEVRLRRMPADLAELEALAQQASDPRLVAQAPVAARTLAACRALLASAQPDVPRAELMARIDRLRRLYRAANLGKRDRQTVEAFGQGVRGRTRDQTGDTFADEIITLLPELQALADRSPSAT